MRIRPAVERSTENVETEIKKAEQEEQKLQREVTTSEERLVELRAQRSDFEIVVNAYGSLRDVLHEMDREQLARCSVFRWGVG